TGTTCSRTRASSRSPTTPTSPVTATSLGTTTVARVPSADTATGRTTRSERVPEELTVGKTTSVEKSNPEPTSVMAWPGLAEAAAGSAGVPLAATDSTPVSVSPNATLVPPSVVTLTGPKPASVGTVTLSPSFSWAKKAPTSGPPAVPTSATAAPPRLTVV